MAVKFGLIGAGLVGQLRARSMGGGAELCAVADPNQEAARRAGGGAVHSDYRRLLDDQSLEAVIVSTPAPFHHEMVLAALQAGKHVLCEKPLGIHPEQCRAMVEAARQHRRVLAVGLNQRYFPCIQTLKSALPRIGPLQHVRALCGHRGMSEFRADWMYRSELSGGGVMMDLGLHLTDLVSYLFGDVVRVYGQCSNRLWEVPGSEDHATAVLTTRSGCPVAYHASWGEWKGYRLVLEAYGSQGVARAFYAPMLNMEVLRSPGRPAFRWSLHARVNLREKFRGWETTVLLAFQEELRDFLARMAGRPEDGTLADGEAGWRAVAAAHALYRSQETGQPVRLEEDSPA